MLHDGRELRVANDPVVLRVENCLQCLSHPALGPGYADEADMVAELFQVPVDGHGAAGLGLLIQEPSRDDAVLGGKTLHLHVGVAIENNVADEQDLEIGEALDRLLEFPGRT